MNDDMVAHAESPPPTFAMLGSGITHSDALTDLAGALVKAQAEIEGAVKGKVNPAFRQTYADLAAVWDACRPALTNHGLSVLQPAQADGAKVTVTTILLHVSGQWIAAPLTITAQQATAQGVGSALTYARRYGLSSMVGIAPEDDDGNAASEKAPPPKAKAAPTPTPAPTAVITEAQRQTLLAVAKDAGWTGEELKGWLARERHISSTKAVPAHLFDALVEQIAAGHTEEAF